MILREAYTPKKLEHQKNQSSNIKKIKTHTLAKLNKQKSKLTTCTQRRNSNAQTQSDGRNLKP
jgi:polysaccharide pyruvyl transferase WcaK-like protein